jgi:hypothetical protein
MTLRTATLLALITASIGLGLRILSLLEVLIRHRFISMWIWSCYSVLSSAALVLFFAVLFSKQKGG